MGKHEVVHVGGVELPEVKELFRIDASVGVRLLDVGHLRHRATRARVRDVYELVRSEMNTAIVVSNADNDTIDTLDDSGAVPDLVDGSAPSLEFEGTFFGNTIKLKLRFASKGTADDEFVLDVYDESANEPSEVHIGVGSVVEDV